MTEAYPLRWPAQRPRTPTNRRRSGKFSQDRKDLSMAGAIRRLMGELGRIGARITVINSNIEPRLDGLPRSGQRKPDDPGVAVYFQLGGKPHCLPCDTYTTVEANLAAVAAHIEATRAIERHGVASVSEMFSGFAALEAPGEKSWWDVLRVRPDASRDDIEKAFRQAARTAHPDAGGSHAAMAEINAARDAALTGGPRHV